MIQGKYNFGDHVFIDSKYTFNQEDVIYHELTHHAITQGSLYSVLQIALNEFRIWHDPEIEKPLKELFNASLTTQEMTATYAQCLYYKLHGEKELSAFENHLHKGDYYKKYCISGFDEIVHCAQYEIDGTSLLTAIAIIALNTDITLEVSDWRNSICIRQSILNNQLQYHVDYRYRRLVKAVLQLIRQREHITEEKILLASGVTYIERNYDNMATMLERLTEQISVQYDINNGDLQNRIANILAPQNDLSGRLEIYEIKQRVLPALLNNEYVFPPSGSKNFNFQMNSVTVVLHDNSFVTKRIGTESNKIDCLIFHHAATGWRYPVTFERDKTILFLNVFQGEIIVFTEDYDEFNIDIQLTPNKRVFYRYDGMWKNFVKQIRSQKTPYVHLHEINNLINCVFVINEKNEVFFTLQLKNITPYIIEDIRNGNLIYANIAGDNKSIRDCFYLTDTGFSQ